MSSWRLQALAWAALGGGTFLGWALMTFTTPTKEDMLKRYPEDAENLKLVEEHNASILKALEETAKSKEPFWIKK